MAKALMVLLALSLPKVALSATLLSSPEIEALYGARMDQPSSLRALMFYKEAISRGNTTDEWKAARAAWWVGTRAENPKTGLPYFEQGVSFAESAVRDYPESTEAHFWLASNLLSYGNAKGAFSSLRLIRRVRDEMAIVLKQNPSYLGGGADRVLGILDYKVPKMFGGDRDRALSHLQRSMELNPDNPVTTFYLADFYYSGGNKEKARQMLEAMRTLKPSEDFLPEYILMLPQAEALRQKIGS